MTSFYNKNYDNSKYVRLAELVARDMGVDETDQGFLNFMVKIQDYALFLSGEVAFFTPYTEDEGRIVFYGNTDTVNAYYDFISCFEAHPYHS